MTGHRAIHGIRRRSVTIVLLLWAGGALALSGLDEVRDLVRSGRLDAAETRIDAYLATQPADPQARFLKSVVLVRLGRTEDAILLLRTLAKDYPQLPEPHNNLAVLYAAQGNYESARDALVQAVSAHPSYATAHENLGDVYVRMAAEAYDKAREIDPGNQSAKTKLTLLDRLFQRGEDRPIGIENDSPASGAGVSDAVSSVAPEHTTSGVRTAVRASLESWASAWSQQDVDGYLAHYAPTFKPPRGLSRAAWERQRRARLKRPARIEVKLSALRFQSIAAQRVQLRVTQNYRSDSYHDRVDKRITVVLSDGRWRIASERTAR